MKMRIRPKNSSADVVDIDVERNGNSLKLLYLEPGRLLGSKTSLGKKVINTETIILEIGQDEYQAVQKWADDKFL